MNEVLGPIYYLFATDSNAEEAGLKLSSQSHLIYLFKLYLKSLVVYLLISLNAEHAEADAFFCFTNLMAEIMNNFCKVSSSAPSHLLPHLLFSNILISLDHSINFSYHPQTLDKSEVGIEQLIKRLSGMLKHIDPPLWKNLVRPL
jgi:hypothetical protein